MLGLVLTKAYAQTSLYTMQVIPLAFMAMSTQLWCSVWSDYARRTVWLVWM